MFNPMTLEGRRILITGASSGIGRVCAIMASRLGAEVVLIARRKEALEETRLAMDAPNRHRCFVWDFAKGEDLSQLMAYAVEGGALSGLVHAAGLGPATPIGLQNIEEARQVFEVNTISFLALMKYCSKRRIMREGGSVVALSSVSALAGWNGIALYSGTKGALSSMVRSLAIELVSKRIRVNAVCPSNIRTPMLDAVVSDLNDAEGIKTILSRQPLGLGEPEQVAAAVCFLLSDAASFITGVNLPVDGGYLAQ